MTTDEQQFTFYCPKCGTCVIIIPYAHVRGITVKEYSPEIDCKEKSE